MIKKEEIICLNCGVKTIQYKCNKRKFCSMKCYNESKKGKKRPNQSLLMKEKYKNGYAPLKGKMLGDKNPMKRPEIIKKHLESVKKRFGENCLKVKRICKVCKKEFMVHPRQIKKNNGKFCSRKCMGLAHRTGKKDKCAQCGKTIYVQPNVKQKFCSLNCSQKYQKESFLGDKNPAWIDGRSFEPYTSEFYKKRLKILKRDDFTCKKCGLKIEKQSPTVFISVHHIDYNKKNNKEENLITLCNICNTKANKKRDYWKAFYIQKMRGINGLK